MLSIIIPTRNSERPLVPTLAALVPGATTGLVAEVLIADGGSQDDTAAVADVAGCNFLTFTCVCFSCRFILVALPCNLES